MKNLDLTLVNLVAALAGRIPADRLAERWRGDYLTHLTSQFERLTAVDASDLLARARGVLDVNDFNAVLLSPRISWRLLRANDAEEDVLALREELCRALESDGGPYSEEGCLYVAGVFVDTSSSYDCPPREHNESPLLKCSDGRDEIVLELLSGSLEILRNHGGFESFVRNMTGRIVFRIDPFKANQFASGSFRDHAGLTLLVNAGVYAGNPCRIVDAVVHEAIHSAIYMYEPLVERMCRIHPDELRVQSPWSGRMLPLDQYVQACFVWLGLLNLWIKWPARLGNEGEVSVLLARVLKGFLAQPIRRLKLNVNVEYIADATWDALHSIEEASEELIETSRCVPSTTS